MNKKLWTWSIGVWDGKYYVYLEKGTLRDEIYSAFGGWCLNHGWYSLGNKYIFRADRERIKVMNLPISYAQAVALGWELEDKLSPEEQAADRTWDEPFFEKTFRSNRPAGCHPSDCCGDPGVHGAEEG
jgi:hypothetical protein